MADTLKSLDLSFQFKSAMNEFCKKLAKDEGVELSEDFNAEEMLKEISGAMQVVPEMLNASAVLRKNGMELCTVLMYSYTLPVHF